MLIMAGHDISSVQNSGTTTAPTANMPGHTNILAYSNYIVVPDQTQRFRIMTAYYIALVEGILGTL